MVSIPVSETSVSNSEQPNIAIIGVAAFLHVSKPKNKIKENENKDKGKWNETQVHHSQF